MQDINLEADITTTKYKTNGVYCAVWDHNESTVSSLYIYSREAICLTIVACCTNTHTLNLVWTERRSAMSLTQQIERVRGRGSGTRSELFSGFACGCHIGRVCTVIVHMTFVVVVESLCLPTNEAFLHLNWTSNCINVLVCFVLSLQNSLAHSAQKRSLQWRKKQKRNKCYVTFYTAMMPFPQK